MHLNPNLKTPLTLASQLWSGASVAAVMPSQELRFSVRSAAHEARPRTLVSSLQQLRSTVCGRGRNDAGDGRHGVGVAILG